MNLFWTLISIGGLSFWRLRAKMFITEEKWTNSQKKTFCKWVWNCEWGVGSIRRKSVQSFCGAILLCHRLCVRIWSNRSWIMSPNPESSSAVWTRLRLTLAFLAIGESGNERRNRVTKDTREWPKELVGFENEKTDDKNWPNPSDQLVPPIS